MPRSGDALSATITRTPSRPSERQHAVAQPVPALVGDHHDVDAGHRRDATIGCRGRRWPRRGSWTRPCHSDGAGASRIRGPMRRMPRASHRRGRARGSRRRGRRGRRRVGERRRLVRRARARGLDDGDRARRREHGCGTRDGRTGDDGRARGQRARDRRDRAGVDGARARPTSRRPTSSTASSGPQRPRTRLTVAWTPGRDDRGVTGYAVDRDGVELETVTEPEIAIDGLACGTAVTVGVRALDEAGNAGLRAVASLQTAACDGPADLYLAPKGRDRNRCTQAAPCRSFARAYALAEPGQTVELAEGRYGRQRIAADATRTSLDDVTFRPAAGAKVIVGSLFIDASHITVRDMRLDGDWTTSATTEDVTFRNLDVRGGIYICQLAQRLRRRRRGRADGRRAPAVRRVARGHAPRERARGRCHLPRRQPHERGVPRGVPADRRRRGRDGPELALHALRDLRPRR